MNEQILKRYTLGEEIFNSTSHGIGAVLSACGLTMMLVLSAFHGSSLALGASLVYGISLIVLYTMSTLYHAITHPRAKEILRIFDHTSIFVLIAGSYTPFCLIALQGNPKGTVVAAAVWVCAVSGIVLNAVSLEKTAKLSMVLYVAMGWSIVAIFGDIIRALPAPAFWLLLLGGVSYTGGIVFYAVKKRYMHSIWHLFVLMGSVLHFLCISIYVLPMAWA